MEETAGAASPADLFAFLDAQAIAHRTLEHPAVFRVEDGQTIKAALPGGHTKNLFLKDAKGQIWLVCALGETEIDLKRLPGLIGSAKLSFGSADLLHAVLGVRPGSVTLFALINDSPTEGGHRVRLILDAALLGHALVNFHPLINTATTAISIQGLWSFLKALDITPLIVDFAAMRIVAAAR